MASGKPRSPSTTAMSTSLRPRFLSSLKTFSKNLAPSVCSIHRPGTSLRPSARTPSARYTALFLPLPSSWILSRNASKIDDGIHCLQRALLPLSDLFKDFIGDRRNQVRRNLRAKQLKPVALDFTYAHTACIHADNLIAKARQASLMFGHQPGLKARQPVSWNVQLQRFSWREFLFLTAAVAVVFSHFAFVVQVMTQLCREHALSQQLVDQFNRKWVRGFLLSGFLCGHYVGHGISLSVFFHDPASHRKSDKLFSRRIAPLQLIHLPASCEGCDSTWFKTESTKSRKQKRSLKQMHADLCVLGFEGSYDRVAAFARQWKVDQLDRVNAASKGTMTHHH